MHRLALVVVLAVIASCGPSFVGTWDVPATKVAVCNDSAQNTNETATYTWSFTETRATGLSVSIGDTCDPIAMTMVDRVGTLTPQICPVDVISNFQRSANVDGGTLTLADNTFSGSVRIGATLEPIFGGPAVTCVETYTVATATRQ